MKSNIIFCPDCKSDMEWCSNKVDKTKYQYLCRNCLCFWDMLRLDCTQDEIEELARIG